MEWLSAAIQGALIGGLYALFATGLSLIFGVMRIVNIAHGDMIVLSAYLALAVAEALPIHPLLTIPIVAPLMFALGYGLQRGILNRTVGRDVLSPLLVTFGLSIIIQNALLAIFTADNRKLQAGALETGSLRLAEGLAVGWYPLLIFAVAVVVIGGLQFLSYRTSLGRAFRATSDDAEAAGLMGIDARHVFALAMALALAVCAVAAVLVAIRTSFTPTIGPTRLLFAFEAIIIGGTGSLWGTLAGGVILGIAQSIGAQIDPGYQILAGHIAFLAILSARPQGLFRKVR